MTGRLARLREAVPDRFEALLSGVRFGQFVSVGVVGAVCDTTVLVVLTEVFGVLPEIATILGIETAILVMFAINDNWTFDAEGEHRSLGRRLLRSHAVRAGGSTTQFVVFVVVYRLFFVPLSLVGVDLWLLVAKGSGIGIGMFVNYVFESLFTWQVHQPD
jgi:putative flippase GtrA